MFSFKVESKCGMARAGVLETARGKVESPFFMPVATHGAVKALLHEDVEQLKFNMVICNTYHLEVRPGIDVIAGMGGLHKFIGWPGLIATDSGGFQVFSLAKMREIDDSGVSFRSHVDGVIHRFTPENVVERQEKMGSDVAMVLDVCSRADAPREEIVEALERTTEWAKRARNARKSLPGGLFGIIQGGTDHDLRRLSASEITAVGFDGYAVGGLSVGEEKPEMLSCLDVTIPLLPENAPRYLMGVGEPGDVLEAIGRGVDMFDCVFPTRVARNGLALTWSGRLVVRNAPSAGEDGPIDPACKCVACTRYGRAYLRHLIRAKEMMGMRLLSLHNLAFMKDMMDAAREAILAGRYDEFKQEMMKAWRPGPEAL